MALKWGVCVGGTVRVLKALCLKAKLTHCALGNPTVARGLFTSEKLIILIVVMADWQRDSWLVYSLHTQSPLNIKGHCEKSKSFETLTDASVTCRKETNSSTHFFYCPR